ncbi:SusE domain-containing protein [Pedobacter gandavensis]|uniref:SusF/SusE family outer membrane protein n=1 Tax=Pedobacter gandavensis TaxID=2679963 RepID=A0ABR6EXQ8_9SPHI|nr:SusE domain-containing protein [Pedobacter gandavensis]MBB2149609.1 SusF/SusE family outer membrane protein [Pedobacter gandavensis]
MKSNIIKYISLVLVAIGLWSCKKDGTELVSNVSPAGTLTASTSALDLSLANAANTAVTLSFPAPVITGVIIPVTTTIQIDRKGKDFSNPTEVVVTTASYAPKVSEINAILLGFGFKAEVPAEIEVRLKSAPAPNAITYSNVLTLKATPYFAASWVYAPGAYNGWGVATADSLVSPDSDGKYTGIINFPTDQLQFKITPKKSWDFSYGVLGGLLSSDGSAGNLAVPKAGTQLISVDLNTKTFSIVEADLWSMTGSATPLGWGSDIDMKFINDGKKTWKVTADLLAGELKFRKNHDYGSNYGGSGGNLVFNSSTNIPVAQAGNYTITFDIPNLKYTLVKN